MAEKIVIMIRGKTEAGKGSVADILENKLKEIPQYNIIRCSLSTWIRETMKKDFYWDGIDTPESRKCMAEIYRVGTEFYPYHMARRVWERNIRYKFINEEKKNNKWVIIEKNIVLVESFREKNNFEYFYNLLTEGQISDLITVSVERPGYVGTQKLTDHISEIDLDDFDFDYYIINDGTLEELEYKVQVIIADIIRPRQAQL